MRFMFVIGLVLVGVVAVQGQAPAQGSQIVRPDQLAALGVSDLGDSRATTTRVIGGRRLAVVPQLGQAARRRTSTTTTANANTAARSPGIPPAAARSDAAEEDLGPPIPYAFNFASNNEDGGSHSREESRDSSGTVTGSYTISDPDGRRRTVRYVADENGFRAEVETNEIGTETHAPAGVNFNSAAPTVAQLVADFEAERGRSAPLTSAERRSSAPRTTVTRRRATAAAAAPAEDNESAGSRARVVVLSADQLNGPEGAGIVQLLRSGRARIVSRN